VFDERSSKTGLMDVDGSSWALFPMMIYVYIYMYPDKLHRYLRFQDADFVTVTVLCWAQSAKMGARCFQSSDKGIFNGHLLEREVCDAGPAAEAG